MKTKLALFFIILSLNVYSQRTPAYEVPNFAAKSPEAAAFLRYGEYPVDLSTGVPGISIPIYTIDSHGFKLPITLDYHASGVKVDQEATWVGLGWNLNAGAQIILSVRDGVDEGSGFPDIPTPSELNYWNQHPYAFNSPYFNELGQSRVKDVYQFSSPTAKGNFYIRNRNRNDVVVFPPDAFRVELQGDDGFRITDASGNIYFFESTREVSYRTDTHHDYYTSAWYVDKIQIPHKDIINFTYQDDGTIEDYSFSQRKEIRAIRNNCGCNRSPPESTTISELIDQYGTTITHAKKIQEISFNNGNSKVIFTKINGRQDLIRGTDNGYLDKIEIRRKSTGNQFEFINGYQFEYTYFNATDTGPLAYKSKRLQLTQVTDLLVGDSHRFTYSALPLPAKDSKSRDYFGFYNGAGNYIDMIPTHRITVPYETTVGTANRTVNPTVNQAGILKEIAYPTKGRTKFNYETNQFWGLDPFRDYNRQVDVSCSAVGIITGMGSANPNPDDIYTCVNSFTVHNQRGDLRIEFSNRWHGNPISRYYFTRVKIMEGRDVIFEGRYSSPSLSPVTIYNLHLNGSYDMIVEAYGESVSIAASYTYTTNNPIPENINAGGLRIASIENYNHDNTLLSKKLYQYNQLGHPDRSSGGNVNELAVSYVSPQFKNFQVGTCSSESGMIPTVDYQKTYSISSNSNYGIEGNSIVYEYVKETSVSVADGSSDGYTQYKFTTEGDWARPDAGIFINTPWKRGKVLERRDYKTMGLTSQLVRKEINTYAEDPNRVAVVNGFKIVRRSFINVGEGPDPLRQPDIISTLGSCGVPQNVSESYMPVVVNHPVPWYYLQNKQVTDYFYDTNNNERAVVNNTLYEYENPLHFNATTVTTTGSEGIINSTKNYYGPDVATTSSLPGGAITDAQLSAITTMNRQNNIAVVQTDQLVNQERTFSKRILYKDWGVQEPIGGGQDTGLGYLQLIAPEVVQSAKGTMELQSRIRYNQYDQYGNPVEVRQENGVPIAYIWGYHHSQPIAKIENATYSSLELLIANVQALSDTSTTGTEPELIAALDALRAALPGAMVTTFTYKPLVGVRTITDPKGNRMTFSYDNFNRLTEVRDKDNKIVSENEYRYRTQN
jgi:YD repeat-containing protein